MINTSDLRRSIESNLKKAISLKIDEFPNLDPNDVIEKSIREFNHWFKDVYHIDHYKFTKDYLDIKLVKDKSSSDDSGDKELVYA